MKLILLIDDDTAIRRSFGMMLKAHGYGVIEAGSGSEGLELARQQLPDLILTDINMRGGGGQELLQTIRQDKDLCSRQVVLMTGRPDLVSPRKGMEQGADDFLLKPVTGDALLACMEARLARADIHWRVQDDALEKWRHSTASVLPHEVYTPLTGILGLAEILSSSEQEFSREERQDLHRDIFKSALGLQRTLRNYFHMLESPAGGDPGPAPILFPDKARALLRQGVDDAVARHDRSHEVAVEWEECPVQVQPADLALIVEELVDNALKFSRAGNPVTVRLGGRGELVVIDSGRGMTEAEIEQIGAYRQFDRKKYEQQGLGLGLALVQKLAMRNGASFSVQRRVEGGLWVQVDFRIGDCASIARV